MEALDRLLSGARRALHLPRHVREEEFKEWRRKSLDPVVRAGACYVPMPGLESTRHYKDKQNLHHLGRYEWAVKVIAAGDGQAGRVLDCASGCGYGSAMLAAAADQVDGIEIDPAAVRLARQRFDRPNITWTEMDAADLRKVFPEDGFDAITCFQTLECIEDDRAFLDDLHALLKPGGRLLIDTPLRKQHTDHPENAHHRRNYSTETYLDLLVPRFASIAAFDALPELDLAEGFGFTGGASLAVCTKAPS